MWRVRAYCVALLLAAGVTARADSPSVDVRLESNVPANVQQWRPDDAEWIDLCATPCEQSLDIVSEYRFARDGLRPTPRFSVHAASVQRIFATMAPRDRRASGIALVATGIPSAFLGTALAVLLVFVAPTNTTCSFGSPGGCATQANPWFPAVLAGAVLFNLVGAVLLGDGGSLWARSRSFTTVRF